MQECLKFHNKHHANLPSRGKSASYSNPLMKNNTRVDSVQCRVVVSPQMTAVAAAVEACAEA